MFSKILCPVDPTEPGLEKPALTVARQLADANGASIVLLAVVPEMPVMAAEYLPPDFHQNQAREIAQILGKMTEGLGLPKERIGIKVRVGRPYHEILDEAEASKADLIVMASHRPRLATYLLGSNAAHVVRHARCSVMALRPEAA